MAKRFDFRLQQVLRLREQKTREVELEQQRVQQLLTAAEQEVEAIENQLIEASVRVQAEKDRPLWPEILTSHSLHAVRVEKSLVVAREKARQMEDVLAHVDRRRSDAMRDEEAIKSLREQQRAAHRLEEERREQVEVDERVMQIWSRKARAVVGEDLEGEA